MAKELATSIEASKDFFRIPLGETVTIVNYDQWFGNSSYSLRVDFVFHDKKYRYVSTRLDREVLGPLLTAALLGICCRLAEIMNYEFIKNYYKDLTVEDFLSVNPTRFYHHEISSMRLPSSDLGIVTLAKVVSNREFYFFDTDFANIGNVLCEMKHHLRTTIVSDADPDDYLGINSTPEKIVPTILGLVADARVHYWTEHNHFNTLKPIRKRALMALLTDIELPLEVMLMDLLPYVTCYLETDDN